MTENKAQMPETQHERAPWIEPALSRLEAGSAELLTGSIDDAADYS
ncbi:MAG TPA: hypothetical protein VF605_20610 [Allosphingosinicella sp.]|jgi:hypothetical protein